MGLGLGLGLMLGSGSGLRLGLGLGSNPNLLCVALAHVELRNVRYDGADDDRARLRECHAWGRWVWGWREGGEKVGRRWEQMGGVKGVGVGRRWVAVWGQVWGQAGETCGGRCGRKWLGRGGAGGCAPSALSPHTTTKSRQSSSTRPTWLKFG